MCLNRCPLSPVFTTLTEFIGSVRDKNVRNKQPESAGTVRGAREEKSFALYSKCIATAPIYVPLGMITLQIRVNSTWAKPVP